jgi:DNA-directed RNA polymerase subunit RPC12/RpoP
MRKRGTLKRGLLMAGALLFPCVVWAQKPDATTASSRAGKAAHRQESSREPVIYSVSDGTDPLTSVYFWDDGTDPQRTLSSRLQWSTAMPTARVDLDLDNVPLRDALKALFDQAKQEFVVEKDVPEDSKITLRVKNVAFATALNAILDQAGVHSYQSVEMQAKDKTPKTTFHITKGKVARNYVSRLLNGAHAFTWSPSNLHDFTLGAPTALPSNPLIYGYSATEQRSTFTCPHCKRQVTVLRQKQTPKCPQCGRTFQSDWKFCPFDGAKRPADNAAEWQFCPYCGKRVS